MSAGYPGMTPGEIENLKPITSDTNQERDIPFSHSPHDQSLIDKVKQKIQLHVELFSEKVNIDAREGVISLSGTIGSLQDKATLEAIIASMPEVLEVINLLELDQEGTVERDLSGHANISLPRKST